MRLLWASVFVILFTAIPGIAQESVSTDQPAVCPILEKLVEADGMLHDLPLKRWPSWSRKKDPKREIGLAILDKNCEVSTIVVIKDKKDLTMPAQTAQQYQVQIVPRLGITWNSHFTHFEVTRPVGASVVKVKYQNFDGTFITGPAYNPELRIPPILERAKYHVRTNVDEAFNRIHAAGVQSRAYQGRVIDDTIISRRAIEALPFMEQSDPDECRADCQTAFEMVLVRLGVDVEKAFSATKSRVGASGLTQFMRGTHSFITNTYPTAGLIRDYGQATSNHVNILMETILLFDYNLGELVKAFGPEILEAPFLEELALGAHNGGVGRVILSVENAGARQLEDWTHGQVRGKIHGRWRTLSILPETQMFIFKFREFLRLNVL